MPSGPPSYQDYVNAYNAQRQAQAGNESFMQAPIIDENTWNSMALSGRGGAFDSLTYGTNSHPITDQATIDAYRARYGNANYGNASNNPSDTGLWGQWGTDWGDPRTYDVKDPHFGIDLGNPLVDPSRVGNFGDQTIGENSNSSRRVFGELDQLDSISDRENTSMALRGIGFVLSAGALGGALGLGTEAGGDLSLSTALRGANLFRNGVGLVQGMNGGPMMNQGTRPPPTRTTGNKIGTTFSKVGKDIGDNGIGDPTPPDPNDPNNVMPSPDENSPGNPSTGGDYTTRSRGGGFDIGSFLGNLLGVGAVGRSAGLFGNGVGTPSGALNAGREAANRADPWGASGRRGQFSDILSPEYVQGLLNPDPTQIAKDPNYQFLLQQGTSAINMGDAASGTFRSGNRGVELAKYGQGLATNFEQQQFQNNMSRLGLLGNFGGVNSSNPGAAGAALMSGFQGATNLQNNGLNTLLGNLLRGGNGGNMGNLGSLLSNGLGGIGSLISSGAQGISSFFNNIFGGSGLNDYGTPISGPGGFDSFDPNNVGWSGFNVDDSGNWDIPDWSGWGL